MLETVLKSLGLLEIGAVTLTATLYCLDLFLVTIAAFELMHPRGRW